MRLDRQPNMLDRGTCSSQCAVCLFVCVWLMLGSFIMRGVKLVVRWCSCWDTISIQRYLSLSLSLSLKVLSTLESYQYKMIYVLYAYIFVVCLLLAVVRFSSWQTYVLLIHRHETRLNFSSSALLLLLLCLFFPFSLSFFFFSVVFVLFVALEKLDFWALRC